MALHFTQDAATPAPKRTEFLTVAYESGRSESTIGVDLSDSPNFIRFTVTGEWPASEQQRQLRESLTAAGELTAATRALIDLRELVPLGPVDPMAAVKEGLVTRVQAYLVATYEQHHFARQCRIAAGPGRVLEIFIEERAALEWLWNADPDY
jgi:hypothetical protein